MRVGIDCNYMSGGRGISTFCKAHVKRLHLAHDIHFVLFVNDSSLLSEIESLPNVKIVYLKLKNHLIWEQMVLPLLAVIYSIDMLHCMGNSAPVYLPRRVRLLTTIHDLMFMSRVATYSSGGNTRQRLGRLYLRTIVPISLSRSDYIVAVSNNTRLELMSITKKSSQEIAVIYEAGDAEYGAPVRDEESIMLLSEYGIQGRFLLCLGAIDPRKNINNIISAYNDYTKRHDSDIGLVITGVDSELLNAINKKFNDSERKGLVLLPFIRKKSLIVIMQQAEALLYVSLNEGFGLPVLDAMHAGTAVITSESGSIPEISGGHVIYADPNSTRSISEAINSLFEDNVAADAMIDEAKSHARSFDWDHSFLEYAKIYRCRRFSS